MVRQLLLVPLLAPLLAAVLIGAINPRPSVALRLLIWTSPALPIGVWMMLAAGGGAALSAGGTALALRTHGERELQRQVRRPVNPWTEFSDAAPGPSTQRRPEPAPAPPSAGPPRAAGESSPTVAVPYRVIRRAGAGAAPTTPAAAHQATVTEAASGQGWGVPLAEGW
jgi:uncharacterized integral membrane protein